MRQLLNLLFFTFFTFGICFSQEELTTEEKLYGLSTLWQEVNYNFAFFDQVPELNWDSEYRKAITEVINSKSNLEYYKLLQKLAAQLQDGHTQVYFPANLESQFSTIKMEIQKEDDEYYVVDIAQNLQKEIPIGSKIVAINNLSSEDYVKNEVLPYLASSTSQGYDKLIEDYFFYGPKGDQVQIEFEHKGTKSQLTLKRDYSDYGEWVRKSKESIPDFNYQVVKEYSLVSLNSFEQAEVIKQFEEKIEKINGTKGLIIDLRENVGGQSIVGLNIAKYLVETDQIIDMFWKSKHHVASHKAWGNSGLQIVGYENLPDYEEFGNLNAWIEIQPDTLQLKADRQRVTVPIKILINENTASSAENFLVFLDKQNNIQTIGTATFGSTGQPIYLNLPGGGYARICAKRNYYPDGREFVGFGIQPDINIENSITSILSGRDLQLEKAFELLSH